MTRSRCGPAGLAALLLLLQAGCALQRPQSKVAIDWDQRRAELLQLSTWQARGRIAVKAEGAGAQGDLQWEQDGSTSRIRVRGPLGAGAYEIRWTPELLTVNGSNGEFSRAYTGADAAEGFLQQQLGWSFPAASVRFWMLGLLDPAAPGEQRFDAGGGLAGLQQSGWSVNYLRFAEVDGQSLPTRIDLENPHARVRLVVDQWTLR